MTQIAAAALLLTFADGTGFYTLVAVRHYSTFYAEWGVADGMEYEDRYEAVEFEVFSDGAHLGSVAAVQHWFAGDRAVLPAPATPSRWRPSIWRPESCRLPRATFSTRTWFRGANPG